MTITDTTNTPTTGADDVRRAAAELATTISERAAEIERARRLPADLLDQLVAAGCLRILLPESHGGVGADFPGALRVFETLARADASTGWTTMIGAGAWCDLAGLPREFFDELFAGRERGRMIVAGAFNPTGSITAVDGGYRVSGRWSFASGCEHADWLWGDCVESVVDGVPHLRAAVLSPDQVVIEDTWRTSGLAGTGSHHFHADDVFVPANRTFVPMHDTPCLDVPIVRVPAPALFSLGIASVAIGAAQGALDEVVALATNKVPLLAPTTLSASPMFHLELAEADAGLRAARALVYESAAIVWARAVDSVALSLDDRARLRAAAVWATRQAASAVDAAYHAGGGSSVYADCTLQRRLRDIHAATQHFLVRRDTMITSGAILAGQDVMVPVF